MKRFISCLIVVLSFLLSAGALVACNYVYIEYNQPDTVKTSVITPSGSESDKPWDSSGEIETVSSPDPTIDSSQNAGDDSSQNAGDDSSQNAGDDSSQNAGNDSSSSSDLSGASSESGITIDGSGDAWSPWK